MSPAAPRRRHRSNPPRNACRPRFPPATRDRSGRVPDADRADCRSGASTVPECAIPRLFPTTPRVLLETGWRVLEAAGLLESSVSHSHNRPEGTHPPPPGLEETHVSRTVAGCEVERMPLIRALAHIDQRVTVRRHLTGHQKRRCHPDRVQAGAWQLHPFQVRYPRPPPEQAGIDPRSPDGFHQLLGIRDIEPLMLIRSVFHGREASLSCLEVNQLFCVFRIWNPLAAATPIRDE